MVSFPTQIEDMTKRLTLNSSKVMLPLVSSRCKLSIYVAGLALLHMNTGRQMFMTIRIEENT